MTTTFVVRGSSCVVQVRRASFGVRRSWFGVRRSSFRVRCSSFDRTTNDGRRTTNDERRTTNDSASLVEWCDRRLLARVHRYTLNRLRAEIEPVAPADFMRFLFSWQHVASSSKLTGLDGLRAVIAQLDGYELAADAWERAVLPARVDGYDASMLDLLCLTGEVGWARLASSRLPRRSSALFPRAKAGVNLDHRGSE